MAVSCISISLCAHRKHYSRPSLSRTDVQWPHSLVHYPFSQLNSKLLSRATTKVRVKGQLRLRGAKKSEFPYKWSYANDKSLFLRCPHFLWLRYMRARMQQKNRITFAWKAQIIEKVACEWALARGDRNGAIVMNASNVPRVRILQLMCSLSSPLCAHSTADSN